MTYLFVAVAVVVGALAVAAGVLLGYCVLMYWMGKD